MSNLKALFYWIKGGRKTSPSFARVSGKRECLAETLKHPHAPEAGAAGGIADMTVLLEFFGLDIIAGGKGATGTYRVIIGACIFPERAECRVVPDIQDSPFYQVAEYLGLHLLCPAAGITEIAVPEEIAGRDVPFPGDESTPFFNEITAPLLRWGDLG